MAGKPTKPEITMRGLLRRFVALWVAAVLCTTSFGCRWLHRRDDPFGAPGVCHVNPHVTNAELVSHLNANVDRIRGWRDTRASISGSSFPVSLNASIAVEGPRKFRLVAKKPIGGSPVADLGSNDQQFWFWFEDPKHPEVITCNHEDLAQASQVLPIPFEPDWLMEVFGVVRIDYEDIDQFVVINDQLVEFRSSRISPNGQHVEKRTVVDRCKGVITEHALLHPDGRIIARAALSQHVQDAASGSVLPTTIDLDWPQARMRLTIKLREIAFNPSSDLITQWQLPEKMDVRRIAPAGYDSNAVTPVGSLPVDAPAAAEFQRPIKAVDGEF